MQYSSLTHQRPEAKKKADALQVTENKQGKYANYLKEGAKVEIPLSKQMERFKSTIKK